jgi:alpha-L-rhamnosidase
MLRNDHPSIQMIIPMLQPTCLRSEYLVDPIGLEVAAPRLSWIDEATRNGERQTAYRILVASDPKLLSRNEGDLWDTGRVESSESAQIVYEGKPLASGQRVWWSVSVWDAEGKQTTSSKPAYWEAGLLSQADWHAKWIGVPVADPNEPRPSPYLRREFQIKGPVESARAYVTARGLYHAWLDGHKLGDGLLTPDWTDYRKRVLYQTYDVTSLLKPGVHALGLNIGDGWYCGHVGLTGGDNYGKRPLGLVQLEIRYRDGSTERVVSDSSWKGSSGPILRSDLLMGEDYDARRELGDWSKPGYQDASWQTVETEGLDGAQLQGQYSPLVTKLEEIHPRGIAEPEPGTYVFDLGQNMVGWVRLKVSGGVQGQKIQLRFAEMLGPDGNVYTTNLRGAKATDTYILKGSDTEVYEPSFTFHGFRYVELRHYPGTPGLDAITGVVIGSDTPKTGTFACSNAMVNQLQHNIFWGQRGNYVSIPTDCPQRDERLGWMGDAQIFARTACFNNDVAGFLTKWTEDVVDAQSEAGGFSDVSPRMGDLADGAPAWGDAGVIVPWTVYLCYGDTRILERRYDSMRKWVEYIDSVNPDHLWTNRRNNDFGDWLNVQDETPKEILATAYFAYSTELLAKAARVIGKTEDAAHYKHLHSEIKAAFQKAFVQPDGTIKGDAQTSYVIALHFGLLPDAVRPLSEKRLVDHVMVDRKGHLSTGFVGVGYICPTLTAIGHSEVAYKLLLNDTYPSWGYEIKHGATTIWERWDGWTEENGFQDPGMNSFNHYAFGSIGEWMYRTVAGIDLDESAPGYKTVVIRPIVGGGLSWAKASLDSLRGPIESGWKLHDGSFELTIRIPANSTAKVYVPGDKAECADSLAKPLGADQGVSVFEVPGGTYTFRSRVQA